VSALPVPARIARVTDESADTRTFVLAVEGPSAAFDAGRPGQFVMLSVPGFGEAAFTLAALPRAGAPAGAVLLTVRRVGHLTTHLFALAQGARVGLRGPFGRGFPDDAPGTPTVYVAGGCGLSPLKAAIDVQLAERPAGTPVAIVYGAREPATRIHRAALAAWAALPEVRLVECVEHPDTTWRGATGVAPDFAAAAAAAIGATRAAICGPAVMMGAAAGQLAGAGLAPDAIHLALERRMHCGVGECGHCYVNHCYVCTDGPVFTLAELRELPDARLESGLAA
jgi:NAD(P)H-flavin reductase